MEGLTNSNSPDVFRIVLHNPTTAHRLLKFSQARMCGENMEFLEKVSPSCCLSTVIDLSRVGILLVGAGIVSTKAVCTI